MVYLICFLCENRNKNRCMKTHSKSHIWITLFEDCFPPLVGILDILNICAHRSSSFFWMALELCSRCTFDLFPFLKSYKRNALTVLLHMFASFFFFLIYFWSHYLACGILVPQPGVEPMHPTVKARSLNHWITVEVPMVAFVGEIPCRINS